MSRRAIRDAFARHAEAMAKASERLALDLAEALGENDSMEDAPPMQLTELDRQRARQALKRSGRL